MTTQLKVAMALLYVIATVLIAGTFYNRADRSWLTWGHALALWFVSVLLPALWTRALVARLEEHDVPIAPLQVYVVMPAWCAVIAALIALRR